MSIFISYASRDAETSRAIRRDIETAGHQTWMDDELGGGEEWWSRILLSLPVSTIQMVDYQDRTPTAGIKLMTAVRRGSTRPFRLPDPLPVEPAAPFAHLMSLADRITKPRLQPAEQQALVDDLRQALRTEADRRGQAHLRHLLGNLREHGDCTESTARDIDAILGPRDGGSRAAAGPARPATDRGLSRLRRGGLLAGSVAVAAVVVGLALLGRDLWPAGTALPSTPPATTTPASSEPDPLFSARRPEHRRRRPPRRSRRHRGRLFVSTTARQSQAWAPGAADDFRNAGWTVDDVANSPSLIIPTSTVYYRAGTAEQARAERLGSEFGLRVAPRFADLADASPGLIVIVVNDYQQR